MIVKVPIYVEVMGLKPEFVEPLVNALMTDFYKHLREKNLEKYNQKVKIKGVEQPPLLPKIISHKEALDSLRKGVK